MLLVKRKRAVILLIMFLLTLFIWGQGVMAITWKGTGLEDTALEAFDQDIPLKDKEPPQVIGTIVGAVLAFVGVLFFILMIYGGFLWMTARGNEQQVAKAKDLIAAAIIGLIIIFSAYAITALIGSALTESS